jgi:MoxR-like ATPase
VPAASAKLAAQVTALVQELRTLELYKAPGVSETIDWVSALVALNRDALDADAVASTLGVVLKANDDIESLRTGQLTSLIERAVTRTPAP